MIPASSVATCARRSIGTAAVVARWECAARHDRCIVTRRASKRSFHGGETTRAPVRRFHVPSGCWPPAVVARTGSSTPEWLALERWIRSPAFFLMSQAAFDTSRMNLRSKRSWFRRTSSGARTDGSFWRISTMKAEARRSACGPAWGRACETPGGEPAPLEGG